MKKRLNIWMLLIFGGVIGALAVNQAFKNAVYGDYSQGWFSESVQDAKNRGVFIKEPVLTRRIIRSGGFLYPIKEAWFEQATRTEYYGLFFRRLVPIGNRLVIVIGIPAGDAEAHFFQQTFQARLVANECIAVTNFSSSRWTGFHRAYGQVEPPFPDRFDFSFKNATPPPD